MKANLPAAFLRDEREDLRADVESYVGMTQEQRGQALESLCAMAMESVAQQADPQRTLDWQDPLSPEARAVLDRLRIRTRAG